MTGFSCLKVVIGGFPRWRLRQLHCVCGHMHLPWHLLDGLHLDALDGLALEGRDGLALQALDGLVALEVLDGLALEGRVVTGTGTLHWTVHGTGLKQCRL